MKKFIFGLMLLISMLGIVGCANPSNFEDDTYIISNDMHGCVVHISYEDNSDNYVNEKDISSGETYEIPASNAKVGTDTNLDSKVVNVIYVKIILKADIVSKPIETCLDLTKLKKGEVCGLSSAMIYNPNTN